MHSADVLHATASIGDSMLAMATKQRRGMSVLSEDGVKALAHKQPESRHDKSVAVQGRIAPASIGYWARLCLVELHR